MDGILNWAMMIKAPYKALTRDEWKVYAEHQI